MDWIKIDDRCYRSYSRYGAPRTLEQDESGCVAFTARNVLCMRLLGDDLGNPVAIDPDGGPFLGAGSPCPFGTIVGFEHLSTEGAANSQTQVWRVKVEKDGVES